MRWLAVLAMLTLACGGAKPQPRTPCPTCPAVACPDCPAAIEPGEPEGPATALLYPDAEGWYCIDDPAVKDGHPASSYCWFKRADCERAHALIAKKRPTVEPCRPQAPAYCYNKYSSLLQVRRSQCAASMEHCEGMRDDDSKDVLPEEGYEFSPCTEQP